MSHSMPRLVALSLVCSFAGCSNESPAPAPAASTTTATLEGFTNIKSDGNHYFTGLPTAAGIASAKQAGVKVVVSSLGESESKEKLDFDEAGACSAAGMEYVNIPVKPDAIDRAAVDQFAKVWQKNDGKVLFHCASGNRSAALYAAYLAIHEKMPVEEAITKAKALGLSKDATIEAVRKVAAQP